MSTQSTVEMFREACKKNTNTSRLQNTSSKYNKKNEFYLKKEQKMKKMQDVAVNNNLGKRGNFQTLQSSMANRNHNNRKIWI